MVYRHSDSQMLPRIQIHAMSFNHTDRKMYYHNDLESRKYEREIKKQNNRKRADTKRGNRQRFKKTK